MKLILLASILISALCSAAPPKNLEPIAEWKGSIDDAARQPVPSRVITDAVDLARIWKDWKVTGEVPKINFAESCIVAETTSGSILSIQGRLSEDGDLRTLGMATRDLRPGFRYVLAHFSTKGVKTINGTKIKSPTLSGKITSRAGGEIPPGATVTVSLLDVSLADAPSKTLAEQIIQGPAKFPLAYALRFEPATLRLEHAHFYSLSTRIEKDGKLLYLNDTRIPIAKNGTLLKDVAIPVIKIR